MPAMPTMPTMPSIVEVKQSIASKIPALPQIPPMPPVREYLPEVPELPKIPLPEPLDSLKERLVQLDTDNISPLVQRLNYIILLLSVSCISMSQLNEIFVFKPVNIYNVDIKPKKLKTESHFPYLWTFLTSVFIDTSIPFLAMHLFIINYIVIKNR